MGLPQKDLEKAQFLMLKILKEVHRVCQENNIKYFLSDGTLLGAVRHNGFIPWDDDIDIGMLRNEYDEFCKIASEKLGNEFALQTTSTDSGYAFSYAKVMLKGTEWEEKFSHNSNRNITGLYIDIFPYDKTSTNLKAQKKQYFDYMFYQRLLLVKKSFYNAEKGGFIKKIKIIIKKIWASFYKSEKLKSKINNIVKRFNDLEVDFVITKFGGNFYNNQCPLDCFTNLVLHKFEDESFPIPKNYDMILSKLYGDYMTLPDESKRENHNIVSYDFGIYN